MKIINYFFMLTTMVFGGFYTIIDACPTCLAHLKRSDKPFFVRELSAQIAATQTAIKTVKQNSKTQQNKNTSTQK